MDQTLLVLMKAGLLLHDVCKLDPSGSYPELTAELIEPDRGWRSGWLTAA